MRTQKILFSGLAAIATLAVSLPVAAQRTGEHSTGSSIAIHGMPASVTSFGFGGRPGFHGVPASVTSFGFGGRPGFHGVPASVTSQGFGTSAFRKHQGNHQEPPLFSQHHHRGHRFGSPFYGGVVGVPYAYPWYTTEAEDDSVNDPAEQEDDRGGPTVFDRRGAGTDESAGQQNQDEDYRTARPSEPAPQPAIAEQPSTVLVFKDGRRLEVSNYAIAGSTLYNLSDGLPRKVALAELDLPATVKQNDDRGVDFQLPAGTKLN
jgi:hypothetical protein